MADWSFATIWRDLQERPLAYPLFRLYGAFMDIKRYDAFPFYIQPWVRSGVNREEQIINLLDWLCDAHEESRNTADKNKSFYMRAVYTYNNFLRYQNDTVRNVMFDTKAPKQAYDRLNSVISQQNLLFYLSASAFHTLGFIYTSFFFRYRRITLVPTLLIGTAYFCLFENINNILYKVIVDKKVLEEARTLGLDYHTQPVGTRKNRGINYI